MSLLILSWVFCGSFISNRALAYKLPDTGQSQCYNQSGAAIACSAPGGATAQDGSYSMHPVSLTDNGNGTVTDNNTGLMWQQQDSVVKYNWYQASGTPDATSNPGGLINVCGSAATGGHTDWRLPTKRELLTIVDYSVPIPLPAAQAPAINTVYFPNTQKEYYWTATELVISVAYAWYVSFTDGGDNSITKINSYPVRCVRGATLGVPAFVDHLNGTATDLSTGLMWMTDEISSMTWDSALAYCESAVFPIAPVPYPDWRLPDIKELESLSDDRLSSPSVPITIFPHYHNFYYWSSTTSTAYPSNAWTVDLTNGYVSNRFKTAANYYLRCVRGGQYGSLAELDINPDVASGTVKSAPAGIDCGLACSAFYPINTTVNLTVIPDVGAAPNWPYFKQWTGDSDCSDGVVTLDVSKTCSADVWICNGSVVFLVSAQPVTETPKDTIFQAYLDATGTALSIELVAVHLQETVDFNLGKDIVLVGGLDCSLAGAALYPYTFVTGSITVSSGSVTIEGIIIM